MLGQALFVVGGVGENDASGAALVEDAGVGKPLAGNLVVKCEVAAGVADELVVDGYLTKAFRVRLALGIDQEGDLSAEADVLDGDGRRCIGKGYVANCCECFLGIHEICFFLPKG